MIQAQVAAEPLEEPIILPWNAVSSKVTSVEYLRKSRYFLEFGGFVDPILMHHKSGLNRQRAKAEREEIENGMREFIAKSARDPRFARSLLIRFIEAQKKRMDGKEIGANHLRNSIKPIKLALDMNEVPLAWKKLMRLVPNSPRKGSDREYTLDEVARLLNKAGQHVKVAILFMASCGMRIGAFDYLNVGHVKPLEQDGKLLCGQIKLYGGEGDDEYDSLVSKEAYLAFQEYLQSRRGAGEVITDESPAIVIRGGNRRCKPGTIRNALSWHLWEVGIRTERKKRYDVQVDHGFRKFFDNVAKDYIPEEYVEKLIGHSGGTKEHYDRHLPKPLVEAYLKAQVYLSIDPAYRAEAELSKKLQDSEKVHNEGLRDLRLLLFEKDSRVKTLEDAVQELGTIIKEIQKEREKQLGVPGSAP